MKKFCFNHLLMLVLTASALVFTSCDSKDTLAFDVSALELSIPNSGGKLSFDVMTNREWSAESDQTWCVLSVTSGKSNTTIDINVQSNSSTVERSAVITVKSSGSDLNRKVTITQAAGSPPKPDDPVTDDKGHSLNATPSPLDFLNIAGRKTLQIKANVAWEISSNQTSWCTLSTASGNGDATVNVTVTANSGQDNQIATLTLANSEYSLIKYITITQMGVEPSILISPDTKNIGAEVETINITVSANVEFDVTPNAAWITVAQATATSVTLQAQANTMTGSRTGTVTFKQKGGNASATLTVTQDGVSPASVIIYVASTGNDANDGKSWSNAVKNISTGIYLAPAGGQVWVAEGSYSETVVMKNGVNVYGGFNRSESSIADRGTRRSILSGSVFTSTNNFTTSTIIDGFTINGDRNSQQTLNKNSSINNCELTVNANVTSGNYGLTVSGGVISNSTVSIYYDALVSGTNTILNVISEGMLFNCRITTQTTTTFYHGVTINLNGGRLEGCIMTGNASLNSFLQYSGTNNNIVNCTFYNINKHANAGETPQFLIGSGSLNFVNNIVLPHDLRSGTRSGLYEANNMQGLLNSTVYYLNSDYSPMSNSPAVNGGNNAYVTLDKDINGNPRIQKGTVDIGAIESGY